MEKDFENWDNLQYRLTTFFGICSCQRKLKTIIDNLVSIKEKLIDRNFNFTGSEWLIIAILDKNTDSITHGINCEYPIINTENPMWKWIDEVKDNPN